MSTPLTFQSASPLHSLPYLFSAQAQKEIMVNEAFSRIDMLLHPQVVGIENNPPAAPGEGECWIVGTAPTGAWDGQSNAIAGFIAGGWMFSDPVDGMMCWDQALGGFRVFNGNWARMEQPSMPVGGATIDAEARQAIDNLIQTLSQAGILTL